MNYFIFNPASLYLFANFVFGFFHIFDKRLKKLYRINLKWFPAIQTITKVMYAKYWTMNIYSAKIIY